MRDGCYKLFNWESLESRKVNFTSLENTCETCGSAALSLITNKRASLIDTYRPKNQKHWSSNAVVIFLRNKHFRVVEVTKLGLTSEPAEIFEEIKPKISPYHVLLTNQLVCKDEATWFLIHKNKVWHNMKETPLNPLHFIQFPIQTIYVVWKKEWS